MVAVRRSYGQTRASYGGTQIFTEKGWEDYPAHADSLIAFAERHGWSVVSNGIPVRQNADGDLIIAVYLARTAGPTPRGTVTSECLVRIPWVCQHTVFHLGAIVVQIDRKWVDVESIKDVQRLIFENAVPEGSGDDGKGSGQDPQWVPEGHGQPGYSRVRQG